MRKTFPKDNDKRLKQTVHDLRAQLKHYMKENDFLRRELSDIMKPVRKRKDKSDVKSDSFEAWRDSFLKRFNKEVLGKP